MTITEIANKNILPANMGKVLEFADGDTNDIVKEILEVSKAAPQDTRNFAKFLIGKDVFETCKNDFKFVFDHIKYKVDPDGYQYVKTPSRTWESKLADCKSLSIFLASLLQNQGIPYKFRFVSFRKNDPTLTHVYVVVPYNSTEIILDVVTKQFNFEKPYKHKQDMTRIYKLSGIGAENVSPVDIKINLGNKPINEMTDGELTAWIARDRAITEKNIHDRLRGIGTLKSEHYQDSIDMINDTLGAIHAYSVGAIKDIDVELGLIAKDAVTGQYSVANNLAGIGSVKDKIHIRKGLADKRRTHRANVKRRLTPEQKQKIWEQNVAGIGEIGKTKTGKFLQKVAKGVKNVTKAVTKVALAPMLLPIKAMLEVQLPKAAPFFLYLFINDKKIIEKLPEKVRAKRKKAEFIANFIVEAIGMKREHFMGIVRNGIMKQMGKSPENILADTIKKAGITGIGIGIAPIIIGAIKALVKIIPKLVQLFKKKKTPEMDVKATDAPDDLDFSGLIPEESKKLANQIKSQPENVSVQVKTGTDIQSPETSDSYNRGGKSFWNSLKG